MKKADYGIDAPGVIRNLFIFSILGFLLPLFFPLIKLGPVNFDTSGFTLMGIACGLMAVPLILRYPF